jgi:hypothetical protein
VTDRPAGDDSDAVEVDAPYVSPPEERASSESGVMNRLIRGVTRTLGFGRDDDREGEREQRDDATDGADDTQQQETAPPDPLEDPRVQERIRREAQSLKDKELFRERWNDAIEDAEVGDPTKLAKLAEAGNRAAEKELAARGFTDELGQVRGRLVQEEDRHQAAAQNLTHIATAFDGAILTPLLETLPEATRAKLEDAAEAGLEGRTKLVHAAVAAIKREAEQAAATKLLNDEKFTRQLLREDGPFRREVLRNGAVGKRLLGRYRDEADEPDLNSGMDAGGRTRRENDEMNDALRRSWQGADYRAADERAAGAGATSRRGQNRDLLDDD